MSDLTGSINDPNAPRCTAALNVEGEHFGCDLAADHVGWAHSNRDHQAIWKGAEFGDRVASLRSAVDLLTPFWDRREPGEYDVSDAVTLARYIETGADPYANLQPLTSTDAMRSHP